MKYEWIIQKTIHWIESHLHEEISANDIDEVTGFSKYHFHRVFQASVGMSVSEYIRRDDLQMLQVRFLIRMKELLISPSFINLSRKNLLHVHSKNYITYHQVNIEKL